MTDVWRDFSNDSLLNRCIKKLLSSLPSHVNDLEGLPANLKDRILHLMCKRGLVTDQNIDKLLHEKVTVLDLSECDISDRSLQAIATRCLWLRKIDLNSLKVPRTEITTEGVCALARQCHHLQVVYLRRCLNLTDGAITTLSECCHQLRDLNIGGCPQITDETLHALGQNCARLRSVDFSKSQVTDDGVYSLVSGASAQSLKEIHMNGCREVTDEAVEAIINSCPQISILLFHGCPKITDQSRLALEEMLGTQSRMKQVTWTIY